MTNNTLKIKKVDGEYQVRFYENGVYNDAKTYFTDDKVDAEETKIAMLKEIDAEAFYASREKLTPAQRRQESDKDFS